MFYLFLKEKPMTKRILLFLSFISLCCYSQDSIAIKHEKTNPIVFLENAAGYSWGKTHGWTSISSLNYQVKNDLYTLRYFALENYRWEVFLFPTRVETVDEVSLLYGKRFIYDDTSIGFSAGVGYVKHRERHEIEEDSYKWEQNGGIGFPFEFNVKWFKKRKRPFRIYWIVPVGKPTSFGGSVGFKFAGNIGRTNYVGFGLSYSYGWHRNY